MAAAASIVLFLTSLAMGSALVLRSSQCPPGVPVVQCFVDPCEFAKCRAFPKAKCVSDFCGGCNARFFVAGKREVTDECDDPPPPGPPCPKGVPVVSCLVDPCSVATCAAFPNAKCVSDFCGGCLARFFDAEEGEVTDDCDNLAPPGPPCPKGVPAVNFP